MATRTRVPGVPGVPGYPCPGYPGYPGTRVPYSGWYLGTWYYQVVGTRYYPGTGTYQQLLYYQWSYSCTWVPRVCMAGAELK